jgi:tRNA 2-selenouridine synthase
MSITKINIETFLAKQHNCLVIDVRTPAEFLQAHIPNAHNLPIFSNEQRVEIGTTFKQIDRQKAIKIGLQYFGPKMLQYIQAAEALLETKPNAEIIVHCWRGGMRSAAMAWLLDLYGYTVYQLVGGYKIYRTWALAQFEISYPLIILGGYTGSGKTYILPHLASAQNKVIDLEGLACHKGSAFGAINMLTPPRQEMFENLLALQLYSCLLEKPTAIFLEDESQRIGNLLIPNALWNQMRNTTIAFINLPFSVRLKHITAEYGTLPKQELLDASQRIAKRLGGLETKNVIQFLENNEIQNAFEILLKYYDKGYQKGLEKRENLKNYLVMIDSEEIDFEGNADLVLKGIGR